MKSCTHFCYQCYSVNLLTNFMTANSRYGPYSIPSQDVSLFCFANISSGSNMAFVAILVSVLIWLLFAVYGVGWLGFVPACHKRDIVYPQKWATAMILQRQTHPCKLLNGIFFFSPKYFGWHCARQNGSPSMKQYLVKEVVRQPLLILWQPLWHQTKRFKQGTATTLWNPPLTMCVCVCVG